MDELYYPVKGYGPDRSERLPGLGHPSCEYIPIESEEEEE
jgi:hypothetical protein